MRSSSARQALIAKVDELGGSVDAIEFITAEIDESAWGYQERYRTGQDIVVGVNKYVEEEPSIEDLLSVDPQSEHDQVKRLEAFKANRDQQLVAQRAADHPRRAPPAPKTWSANRRRPPRPRVDRRSLQRDERHLRHLPSRLVATPGCSRPGGEPARDARRTSVQPAVTRAHAGAGLPSQGAKNHPMSGHTAQRTLVKSPPELWAELSDGAALAKHLGEFGEIRITRLEPETVVAWEGERANGTVSLAPAGWGTKVTLTASAIDAADSAQAVAPEPVPAPEPGAAEGASAIVEHEPQAGPGTAETTDPDGPDAAELEPSSAPAATRPKPTLLGRLKRWLTSSGDGAMWQLSDAPSADTDDTPAPLPRPPRRFGGSRLRPRSSLSRPPRPRLSRQRSRKTQSSAC